MFQLLLNDEQNTSVCVMNAYKDIFKIKRNLLTQFDEKSLNLLLDEIIYKMATSELVEVGLYIQILLYNYFDLMFSSVIFLNLELFFNF